MENTVLRICSRGSEAFRKMVALVDSINGVIKSRLYYEVLSF